MNSEKHLLAEVLPGVKYPDLPASITSLGSDKTGKAAPTGGYLTKAEYLDWFGKVRGATLTATKQLADADLDQPSAGPMAKFAPNLGAMLILVANHTLMHAGQFTVVRRALNKPILFLRICSTCRLRPARTGLPLSRKRPRIVEACHVTNSSRIQRHRHRLRGPSPFPL